MTSGGSAYHWRLVTLLRSYLSKQPFETETVKKDVSKILSLNEGEKRNIGEDFKNQEIGTNYSYSDVKKALQTLNSYIPQMPQVQMPFTLKEDSPKKENDPLPQWVIKKRETISKSSIDARTRHLLRTIGSNNEPPTLKRLEDLCSHLKLYSIARGGAIKSSGVPKLLKALYLTKDETVHSYIYEALALLGYCHPVKGHGINILSIDGGGVRGLVALEILRNIELKSGRPIHELFDMICGVSTGAVLAVLTGFHQLPLDECEKLYREMSSKIFSQTALKGTANLIRNSSFYDSAIWTEVLKTHMGDVPLIETARNQQIPKLCLVSTQVNMDWIRPFLFRNYELPFRIASQYKGTSAHSIWMAVRASAAAPGYFSEFTIGDLILQDGGILVNNPTGIGIHEARHLWPDTPIQSVVSVGTGRHEPIEKIPDKNINWASRIRTIINSATDTEAVHATVNDLLPANTYFRFNPYLSEEITLNEIRKDKIASMMEDTNLYIRKNQKKFEDAVGSLLVSKTLLDKAGDYFAKQKVLAKL